MGRILIGWIITLFAQSLGIEPNPEDRVSGFERLDKAAFELMKFYGTEVSWLCWIYSTK